MGDALDLHVHMYIVYVPMTALLIEMFLFCFGAVCELQLSNYNFHTVSKDATCSHSNTYLAFHTIIVCILGVVHIVRPHLDY